MRQLTIVWSVRGAFIKIVTSILVVVVVIRPSVSLTLVSTVYSWLGIRSYEKDEKGTNLKSPCRPQLC